MLGTIISVQGDHVEALRLLDEAVKMMERVEHEQSPKIGRMRTFLGAAYLRAGKLMQAETTLRSAWAIYEKAPMSVYSAETLNILGDLMLEQDNLMQAETYLEQAHNIFNTLQNQLTPTTAHCLVSLGRLAQRTHHRDLAHSYFERARHYLEVVAEQSQIDRLQLTSRAGLFH